ncbi:MULTISPECIES: lipid-A-disaccharide synthase [Bartonella]|uniref:lipid-A-disaccharide synthase n=1 Tax=Bartonella TaxID=773 RepID=UPI0018DDB963|nr:MULTISPECIES: lipid-A-disaccharide synthase [Bartonella]MBH9975292.1 lipid-A-disaccharide synthase [Bartonella choladocola]MBI0014899.1 lipid-A-disaccharide synthase [Bartonella sp. B10834G3]MBI0140474.1 lipid-A-disaccharide synthase [Bartonella choladocola]
MSDGRLKIAIVAGEESGDLLGADLVSSLARKTGRNIKLIGVGGSHLEALGLKSVFNVDDIALMGLGAVLKKLPKLILHIHRLAHFIADEKPDCLIIIDSPDFTHRVAKKVRKLSPEIPIIKYIAPSVWAWRPERAKAMCPYIDHVLVVLPFEKQVMRDLQGPPATYVGHRLLTYPPLVAIEKLRSSRIEEVKHAPTVVVLPGSRHFEIRGLMPIFGQALEILKKRRPDIEFVLPTLPRLADQVRKFASEWTVKVNIVTGEDEKWAAFAKADAALAASGTVSLELALADVPMVLGYKADLFSKTFILPRVKVWSAALPNIIADRPVVPEYFNEFLRPGMLARQIEQLVAAGPVRQAQLDGFSLIRKTMATTLPSGEIASQAILKYLKQN